MGGQRVESPLTWGDGTCDPDEDCAVCPEDCGDCCGDGTCDAAMEENCLSCPEDCGCPEGTICDDLGVCRGVQLDPMYINVESRLINGTLTVNGSPLVPFDNCTGHPERAGRLHFTDNSDPAHTTSFRTQSLFAMSASSSSTAARSARDSTK